MLKSIFDPTKQIDVSQIIHITQTKKSISYYYRNLINIVSQDLYQVKRTQISIIHKFQIQHNLLSFLSLQGADFKMFITKGQFITLNPNYVELKNSYKQQPHI
ncbi:hypothetical protein pb186bvf_014215 [Paramecium bursaria]